MNREELLQARGRGKTAFPWIDLRGQSLRSLDLRQCNLRQAKLEQTDLSLANLAHASLIKVEGNRVNLSQAILSEVQGTGAFLNGANLAAAILDGADFSKAQLERAQLTYTQMNRVQLTQAELTGANCAQCRAADVKLQEAQLRDSNWSKAQLVRADLSGADLVNCNFQGSDLRSADLRETQLDNTDFSETDLRGAKFSWETNSLQRGQFAGAIMPDGVPFDDQWQPPQVQTKPVPDLRPAPEPSPTRDRPNRYLLINPFFEGPNAVPKKRFPPPRTLTEWRERLPWWGLLGLVCAYAGWGAILLKLNAPLTAIALLLLSSLLPAADLATLPYMPLLGFVATVLAFPNPISQVLILVVAITTGLALGISGKLTIGWSYWQSCQAALWIGEAVITAMLTVLWILGRSGFAGSSVPLLGLSLLGAGLVGLCAPSWEILHSNGLSVGQRSLVSLAVTALGLWLGQLL